MVVLDDPFTSQDNFRRNHTAFQIKSCGEACAQTLVLSHDPYFLKLVWDKLAPTGRKALQLARVGEENTVVAEWDIDKAVQARYRADVDVLQKYYTLGEGSPVTYQKFGQFSKATAATSIQHNSPIRKA